ESTGVLAHVLYYRGEYPRSQKLSEDLYKAARDNGHQQVTWWGTFERAQSVIRLGGAAEVVDVLQAKTAEVDEKGLKADVLSNYSLLAVACLRAGHRARARAAAEKALALMEASRPVAYWNQQSAAAVAEVALAFLDE